MNTDNNSHLNLPERIHCVETSPFLLTDYLGERCIIRQERSIKPRNDRGLLESDYDLGNVKLMFPKGHDKKGPMFQRNKKGYII
jgi:hypothetical protein